MKKVLLLTLFFLCFGFIQATKLYWVGGSGNFNDPAHWALQSGGIGGVKTPDANDDVVFDRKSFRSQSIVSIIGGANCHDFVVSETMRPFILNGSANEKLTISGSLNLRGPVDLQYAGQFYFTSSATSSTLDFGFSTLKGDVYFDGTGEWEFKSNLFATNSSVYLLAGKIKINNGGLNAGNIEKQGASAFTLQLTNSVLSVATKIKTDNTLHITQTNSDLFFRKDDPQNDFLERSTSGNINLYGNGGNPTPQAVTFSNITPCTCHGDCDGSVLVGVSGGAVGSGPYTIQFLGSTPASFFVASLPTLCTGLCADVYNVKVTGSGGTQIGVVNILQPSKISVGYDRVDSVRCNAACDGKIVYYIIGGNPTYTAAWTPAPAVTHNNLAQGVDDSIPSLCIGTYVINITDVKGCTGKDSATIFEPSVLLPNGGFSNPKCAGVSNGMAWVVPSGGSPFNTVQAGNGIFYTTVWDGNPAKKNDTLYNLGPGVHTCVVTDAHGCQKTYNVTLTSPPPITDTKGASTPLLCADVCSGSLSVTSVAGGTSPYVFSWTGTPSAPSTVNSTANSSTASNLCVGTYTVTITDNNGCTKTENWPQTSPPLLVGSVTTTSVTCFGAATGTANGSHIGGTGPGFTFVWLNSAGNPFSNANPVNGLAAGNYSMVVIDANSCNDTVPFTIIQAPQLTVTLTPTNPSCFGLTNGQAVANPVGGTPPYSYVWVPAGLNSPTHNGLGAGNVSVTVTDAKGCTASASTTLVNPPDVFPNVSVTNPSCKLSCNGTATSNPIGGSGPPGYTYLWHCNGNTTNTLSNRCAGSCILTVKDGNGCSHDTTITFVDPQALTLGLSNTTLNCSGASTAQVTSAVAGGTPGYTYCWNPVPGPCVATTPGLSNVGAGTYVLQVTDAHGCVKKDSVIITAPTPIVITTTPTDPACSGGNNGTINTTVSGGTPFGAAPLYTVLWQPSASPTNLNQTGLSAGIYTLTITDSKGCVKTKQDTLTDPTPVTVTTDTTIVSCIGNCDGTATATAAGGNGVYTYSWNTSPVQNTQTAINLCSGISYTATVTDGFGCIGSANTMVTDPPAITVSVGGVTPSCSICNGTGIISTSGGTGLITFTVDGVAIGVTTNLTNLCIGNHTVKATDSKGCSATVIFNVPPQVGLTITTSTLLLTCNGSCNGIATANVAGGAIPITFAWTSPLPTAPASQATQTATNLCAGTHTVVVTDADGCTNRDSVTFTNPAVLTASMASLTQICSGTCTGSSTVTPAGGTPPYSVTWSGGQVGNAVGFLCVGNDTAFVSDANGCSVTKTVTITNAAPITATVSSVAPTCGLSDGSITVTPAGGVGPFTVAWSNPPGGTGNTINGLGANTYIATVTDAGTGCDTVITVGLSNVSGPTTTHTQVDVSCFGASTGSATVDVTAGAGPFVVTWPQGVPAPGPPPQTANNLAASPPSYGVSVSDVNNCVTIETVTINQPANLTPNQIIINVACNGGSTGAIVYNPTGGTRPFTYTIDGIADDSSMTGLAAGPHTVIVTDAGGCTYSTVYVLTEPAALTATESHTNIGCTGPATGTATVAVSGGTTAYAYAWFDASGVIAVIPSIAGLAPGSYTVVVSDTKGCSARDTAVIGFNAPLLSGFTKTDNLCSTGCSGTAAFAPSGGNGGYTYQWNDPQSSTTISVDSLCSGNYQGIVSDNNGCSDTIQFSIIAAPALTIDTVSTTEPSCNGGSNGSITVIATGGTPGYAYSWAPNVNNSATATNLSANTYTATATDTNGCVASVTVNLNQPLALVASITPIQPSCFGLCNGSLDASPSTGGTGPYTYAWSPVAGNAITLSNLCASPPSPTYTLVVTDSKGCKDTATSLLSQPPQVGLSASSSPATCNAVPCDGSITINSIVGISVTWLSPAAVAGSHGLIQNNLCAGIYDIEVIDANSCKDTVQVGISNANGPVVNVDSTDVTCMGACNGTATVVSVTGNAPFTYSWSPNPPVTDTDSIAANLCPGAYLSQVTDVANCITITPVTINGPSPFIDNSMVVNATCSGINNGSVSLTPTGGTAPYNFSWSNGSVTHAALTSSITNLAPGSYSVTITDANLCTYTFNYTVVSLTQMMYQLSVVNNTCFAQCAGSATINSLSGGTAPYIFSWSDPGSQTGTTASGLCAGNYTVTMTDNLGCQLAVDTTISEPTAVVLNPTITSPSCGHCDGQIVVAPSGGTPGYTFGWGVGGNTSTITNVCAGLYNLQITDSALCAYVFSVPVSSAIGGSNSFTVNADSVDATCTGFNGSATAILSGGIAPFTYLWLPGGQVTSSINLQPPGVYSVQVIDSASCSSVAQTTINGPASPVAATILTTPPDCGVCNGQIVIQPSGGVAPYTLNWNPPFGATNDTLSAMCAGAYAVVITDNAGCTDTLNVLLNSAGGGPALVTSVTNVTCANLCNGTATVTPSGGNAPYNPINWTRAGVAIGSGAAVSSLCPGQYVVTVTDATGCINSALASVTQPTPLNLSIQAVTQIKCNNDTAGVINTIPSGGTLPYTFVWTPAQNPSTASAVNLGPGNYSVTITDTNGCTTAEADTIINPPLLVITAVVTNGACNTAPVGSIDVTTTGGTPNYAWQWSGGSTAVTEDLVNLVIGSYSLTVTDANGCKDSAVYNVASADTVIAVAGNDTAFCNSATIMISGLNSTTTSGTLTYNWTQLPATVLGGAPTQSVTPAFGLTQYQLVVSNTNGCTDTDTLNVTSSPMPTADAGADQEIFTGQTATLGGNPAGTGTPPIIYHWTSIDTTTLSGTFIPNPISSSPNTQTYYLTVVDSNNCVARDSMVLTVSPEVKIPNGISPNGDGKNDVWIIASNTKFPDMEVEVYNRWGELLYHKENYDNTWDGSYKGKPLPIGTYYYVVKLNDPNFPDHYTGPITIFK